jgi:hypothetical protein
MPIAFLIASRGLDEGRIALDAAPRYMAFAAREEISSQGRTLRSVPGRFGDGNFQGR